ncbi:MAG: HAD family hydrolase [Candidatus Omnitrophica bacterium]|nr:HAD family hydrolase [Candidatus Omnitrophota bacterium]
MKRKIAIFDLDGTLIDAYKAIRDTVNYCLEKLGYPPVSLETTKKVVGRGDKDLAKRIVKEEDIASFISLYRENHIRFLDGNLKLMEGAEALLIYLKKKNVYIAVATNRASFSIIPVIERLNIKDYFDIIYTADNVEKPKPDPEMIFKILQIFNIKKEQSFFVGDMDIDYLTGKNAGIDTYIVSTGSSPKEELERYSDIKVFDNLTCLKKYLTTKLVVSNKK